MKRNFQIILLLTILIVFLIVQFYICSAFLGHVDLSHISNISLALFCIAITSLAFSIYVFIKSLPVKLHRLLPLIYYTIRIPQKKSDYTKEDDALLYLGIKKDELYDYEINGNFEDSFIRFNSEGLKTYRNSDLFKIKDSIEQYYKNNDIYGNFYILSWVFTRAIILGLFFFIWANFGKSIIQLLEQKAIAIVNQFDFNLWLMGGALLACLMILATLILLYRAKPELASWGWAFFIFLLFKVLLVIDTGQYPLSQLFQLYCILLLVVLFTFILEDLPRLFVVERGNTKRSFVEDRELISLSQDKLNLSEYVLNLVSRIRNLDRQQSWSIGITSPWGTGKSSFVNFVVELLKKHKYEIIVFNPRNSKNSASIQEDFFNTMSYRLRRYGIGIRLMVWRYMEALNVIVEKSWISKLLSIVKIFNKEDIKKELDRTILSLPTRVVIVIDDLDRLGKEELVEVFKLIGGNATFKNVIYITAFDKSYVLNTLNVSSGRTYTDKFFNIEIPVPIKPYPMQQNILLDILKDNRVLNEQNQRCAEQILENNYTLFEKYLPSIRDQKRYMNLFVYDYNSTGEFVNLKDFFLLTLLKYVDGSLYYKLYKKEYLEPVQSKQTANTNKSSGKLCFNGDETIPCHDILSLLFPKTPDFYRGNRIFRPEVFNFYFENRIYKREIEDYFNMLLLKGLDTDKLTEKFKNKLWCKEFCEYASTRDPNIFIEERKMRNFIVISFYILHNTANIKDSIRLTHLLIYIYMNGVKNRVPLIISNELSDLYLLKTLETNSIIFLSRMCYLLQKQTFVIKQESWQKIHSHLEKVVLSRNITAQNIDEHPDFRNAHVEGGRIIWSGLEREFINEYDYRGFDKKLIRYKKIRFFGLFGEVKRLPVVINNIQLANDSDPQQ